MKYAILMFENEADFARRGDPAYLGAWASYAKAVHESGIFIDGAGLQPPTTATTLRLREGKRHVQDGPFADTKEQLGGYFVVDVPSLDDALDWASRSPSASSGCVEVRPVMAPMQG
jgi:hypothetical protein